MLEKGYLMSHEINKVNRDNYLKAFTIIGEYDMEKLEIIFSRSKKTLYKDLKKAREELEMEIKKMNSIITDSILQNYINFVYRTLYTSISLISKKDRTKITREIIENLEKNYKVEFIDKNPIVLRESEIKLGMKEKILYLNQNYNSESNFLFLDENRISNFVQKIIEVLNSIYELTNHEELKKNLFRIVQKKWLGYHYNLLESDLETNISSYPQIEIVLKNLFVKLNMNINDYEANVLVNLIKKYIYVPHIKINILTIDKVVDEIVKKQLLNINGNIIFTTYDECDIQIVPKNLELNKKQLETNIIFDDEDITSIQNLLNSE